MSDKLPSQLPGRPAPRVVAVGNSVVTARQITNAKAKSISAKIELVSDRGSCPSGNVVGQIPQADYIASDNSVICADTYSGIECDGAIDFSVHVQGPAGKLITEHKVELVDRPMADHSFVLQHVHAKLIVTDR